MDTQRTSDPQTELEHEAWPALSDQFIEYLKNAGECRTLQKGEVLFEIGQDYYDFYVILDGEVHIVDRTGNKVVVVIRSANFIGELGWLMGQKTFLAGVAHTECRILVVPYKKMRKLIATIPEVGDVVVSAFAARRRLLTEWGEGGLIIVSDENDKTGRMLRSFANRNQIPHQWINREDDEAMNRLADTDGLPATGTAVVLGGGRVIENPTRRAVAEGLGLDLVADTDELFDLIIVGAGPAGLAGAIYGASEGLKVLVIEDTAIGGQASTSSRIENYFGFPKGISGKDLAYKGEVQAVKFGARITAPRKATRLFAKNNHYEVALDDERCVKGRALLLANGVQYRRLPLDRLKDFEGSGIFYAATDFEARYCQDENVVVVGGGNSAGQAAMFLSRYARCTYVLVRSEGLSNTMSSYLSDRIVKDDRIKVLTYAEVEHLHGDEHLSAITVMDNQTGKKEKIETRALFIMIGARPNTEWLDNQLELDDNGFIVTGRSEGFGSDFVTSLPGIFAVGDIRAGSIKRVASAVGEGSVVVSAVHKYLQPEQPV